MSVCLCVCVSVCLSVCLSVCTNHDHSGLLAVRQYQCWYKTEPLGSDGRVDESRGTQYCALLLRLYKPENIHFSLKIFFSATLKSTTMISRNVHSPKLPEVRETISF